MPCYELDLKYGVLSGDQEDVGELFGVYVTKRDIISAVVLSVCVCVCVCVSRAAALSLNMRGLLVIPQLNRVCVFVEEVLGELLNRSNASFLWPTHVRAQERLPN